MTSMKSMTFLKAHDRKHYLDNKSEDSSKGYLRKGYHLQYYLAKVNENIRIQKPEENVILWKTAWTNLSKQSMLQRHIPCQKTQILFSCNLFRVNPFFHLD